MRRARVDQLDADDSTDARPRRRPTSTPTSLVEDVLVEEVSIDGMCGVY